MSLATQRSVAINIQEKGGGFTARCSTFRLVAHAGTEERALRQLKEQLDKQCPGVRVHLGIIPIVSTPFDTAASLRPSQQ
jgi:hypothetical protein